MVKFLDTDEERLGFQKLPYQYIQCTRVTGHVLQIWHMTRFDQLDRSWTDWINIFWVVQLIRLFQYHSQFIHPYFLLYHLSTMPDTRSFSG